MGQRAEARLGAEDGGKGSETQRRSSEVMAELVGADSGTASSTLPLHRRISTVACQRLHVRMGEFE